MASSGGLVDSFAVGQISELLSKSHKRKQDCDTNSGLKNLFSSSPAVQPVFVPVIEKVKHGVFLSFSECINYALVDVLVWFLLKVFLRKRT